MQLFGKYIESPHLPSSQDILTAIKTHKCLRNRTEPQIRSWLHNQRKSKRKGNYLNFSESSSSASSNNEEDDVQYLISKKISLMFKKHIETKRIPTANECMHI